MQRLADLRGNLLQRSSPVAFQLVFMLALVALAAFLGVAPIFGAMVAGILAGDLRGRTWRPARPSRASPTRSSSHCSSPSSGCGRICWHVRATVLPRLPRVRLPGQVDQPLRRRPAGRRGPYWGPQPGRGPQRPWRARDRAGLGHPGRAGIIGEGFFTTLVLLALLTSRRRAAGPGQGGPAARRQAAHRLRAPEPAAASPAGRLRPGDPGPT